MFYPITPFLVFLFKDMNNRLSQCEDILHLMCDTVINMLEMLEYQNNYLTTSEKGFKTRSFSRYQIN